MSQAVTRTRRGGEAQLGTEPDSVSLFASMDGVPGSVYQHLQRPDGQVLPVYETGLLTARLESAAVAGGAAWPGVPGPIHPADRAAWLSALRRSVEEMTPFACDVRCGGRSGDWIWTRAQVSPRPAEDGSIVWSGLAVEIGDLKRAEADGREREEQLRAFAESASDWFWQTDASHRFTMFTQRFFTVSGLAAEQVLGAAGWEMFLGHPLADDRDAHRRVVAARQPFRDLSVVLPGDGEAPRIAQVSGVPFYDAAGDFRGYRGTGRDVTAQLELERSLREQQALLVNILAHVPVVLFALDTELRFTLCTGDGLAEIGHEPGVAVGCLVEELYPDLPELAEAARRALAGSDTHLEMELAGRVVWSDLMPVRDPGGRVVAVVGLARDMTRERLQARAIEASEARFRSLVTNLRNIVFCHGIGGDSPHGYDAQGVTVYGIDAVDITGAVAINGRSSLDEWYGSIHLDDKPAYLEAEYRRKAFGEPYTLEFRIVHPRTGEQRWLRETAWRVDLPGSSPRIYLDSYIIDLTERRRIETAAQEGEERYRRLIENAPIPILQHADWRCTLVNPAMVELLGAGSAEALIGTDPTLIVAPESRAAAVQRTRQLYEQGGVLPPWEYTLVRRDGSERVVEARTSAFEDGGRWVVQVALTDVTERKRVEIAMRHLAQHDLLTGLPNRALFLDRLGQALAQAQRSRQGIGLMLVDLDGFKAVNDSLGHAAGDALLRLVAERASGLLRASDTFARIGGDEFGVLQTQLRSASGAATLAVKLVEVMAVPFTLDGREVRIGVSIGIALPDDDVDADQLLRRADMALYRAKAAGKGCYAFYESGMNAALELSRKLEAELRDAVAAGDLGVLYQPQVSLADGRLVGVEALVRWPRREGGMLEAACFVPAAESTGLIRALGSWVLRTVCRQAARWWSAGCRVPVAVNVAASELRSGRFVEDLLDLLAAHGLPGSALQVELAEAVVAEQALPAVGEILARLHAAGIGIVIDEFGKAPLALERLSALPVDTVKLHRALVAGVGHEAGMSAPILSATIGAARGLGLRIAATGIETAAQASFVTSCGCDLAQGFLFGPPLPAEALVLPSTADG